MGTVGIVGGDSTSLAVARKLLADAQTEIMFIASDEGPDTLAYLLKYGSGRVPLKGSVREESGAVLVTARYGRGGLRTDRIEARATHALSPDAMALCDVILAGPDAPLKSLMTGSADVIATWRTGSRAQNYDQLGGSLKIRFIEPPQVLGYRAVRDCLVTTGLVGLSCAVSKVRLHNAVQLSRAMLGASKGAGTWPSQVAASGLTPRDVADSDRPQRLRESFTELVSVDAAPALSFVFEAEFDEASNRDSMIAAFAGAGLVDSASAAADAGIRCDLDVCGRDELFVLQPETLECEGSRARFCGFSDQDAGYAAACARIVLDKLQ